MKLDWKAVLGIVVTVFLLWLALRGVEFADVWARVRGGDPWLLLAAVTVATTGFLVRAMRWKVLLHPLRPDTSLGSRFAAVSVGFMANNLLPSGRVGEFARPYALSRVERVSASGAFGTLVVERALDGLTLLVFLLLAMSWPTFPASPLLEEGPLRGAMIGFAALLVVIVGAMVVLLMAPRPFVSAVGFVGRPLPDSVSRLLVDATEAFIDALEILRRPRLLLLAVAWTVGFWLFNALSFWIGFRAFGIDVDFVGAVFTEGVVGLTVALPSAPGFFGTFHWGVDLALHGVYGVDEPQALAFAFGYHLGGWFPITAIGLWYAWRMGLTLGDVGR
ncbi:MAG TPA: lysylphosphatidylglycerol synthase transmembrane domain-containing protein, partial [Longimicrobiales bacterium]|nr:lysylphosphatidylglycerol synthase transmembrane domain-containing protein [Longimicrobiales bacterium]